MSKISRIHRGKVARSKTPYQRYEEENEEDSDESLSYIIDWISKKDVDHSIVPLQGISARGFSDLKVLITHPDPLILTTTMAGKKVLHQNPKNNGLQLKGMDQKREENKNFQNQDRARALDIGRFGRLETSGFEIASSDPSTSKVIPLISKKFGNVSSRDSVEVIDGSFELRNKELKRTRGDNEHKGNHPIPKTAGIKIKNMDQKREENKNFQNQDRARALDIGRFGRLETSGFEIASSDPSTSKVIPLISKKFGNVSSKDSIEAIDGSFELRKNGHNEDDIRQDSCKNLVFEPVGLPIQKSILKVRTRCHHDNSANLEFKRVRFNLTSQQQRREQYKQSLFRQTVDLPPTSNVDLQQYYLQNYRFYEYPYYTEPAVQNVQYKMGQFSQNQGPNFALSTDYSVFYRSNPTSINYYTHMNDA